jgi:hypothetical protein
MVYKRDCGMWEGGRKRMSRAMLVQREDNGGIMKRKCAAIIVGNSVDD